MYTKQELVEQLRKSNCKVVFTKKDGTTREMKCTLIKEVVEDYLTPTAYSNPVPDDVVAVIDTENEGWRRFRVDSVQTFDVI